MKTAIPFLLLILNPAAFADTDQTQVLSQLRSINQVEIKAGQMAQEKGLSKEIKDYGQHLVNDHKKLEADVTQYASKNNLVLSDPQPSEGDKATIETLQSTVGTEFDKKFLDSMVKGHEDAISMVKAARTESKDLKFKTFLASVLPNLEKHESAAQNLEKKAEF